MAPTCSGPEQMSIDILPRQRNALEHRTVGAESVETPIPAPIAAAAASRLGRVVQEGTKNSEVLDICESDSDEEEVLIDALKIEPQHRRALPDPHRDLLAPSPMPDLDSLESVESSGERATADTESKPTAAYGPGEEVISSYRDCDLPAKADTRTNRSRRRWPMLNAASWIVPRVTVFSPPSAMFARRKGPPKRGASPNLLPS
ncbi:hypothetical protein MKEN_00020700 [Mycena kentingensis (nom. inval.)]|nr:hypothetical protein MKEN_00020700 [Mycena kentingensis (nom. inval.)]